VPSLKDRSRVPFRPLTFEGGVGRYECGDLGDLEVPKDRIANLDYRRRIIERCEEDQSEREVVRYACRQSCLWWINTFAWTYLQLHIQESGRMVAIVGGRGTHLPFITWPIQDELILDLEHAIRAGRDVAIDKSRDMGLSWIVLTVFHWFWQFYAGVNFLEISRKLELVDSKGDPDSLFWKHEYLLRHQPNWLRPRDIGRVSTPSPKLVNHDLESTIVGASTTGDVGHAGRRTAVLFDEAARIRELKTAWEGAASMTGCRIANSTPRGPGFFSKLVRSPAVQTIRAPWWDHPQKGIGRRQYLDKQTGKVRVTSPWRDMQIERATTQREISENIDMDHAGAGFTFFDNDVIVRQIGAYCSIAPVAKGLIGYRGRRYGHRDVAIQKRLTQHFGFRLDEAGPWRLWCDLVDDGHGRERPAQDRVYVMGADVAGGTGASNSVISVLDVMSGDKVAEFASNVTTPDELARILCMAGYWFGGAKSMAFLCWEANGYGSICGKHLIRLGYPWVYRTLSEGGKRATTKRTRWPGWWSSEQTKVDVLGDYRSALARDEFRNPSEEALEEAADYIWFEGGGVGPGDLAAEKGDAKRTHGDRVIADALAWHASKWAPRMEPSKRIPPPSTVAERRRRQEERERKRQRDLSYF